jgi:two-component system nitrate/nitrite response regulator NarL
MSRTLIVEDHVSFAEALALVLRQSGFEEVDNVGDLAGARARLPVDGVVILDIDLPDGNGLDLIPEIVAASPSCEVLVLTGSVDRIDMAIEAGASGVMHKSVALEEIVRAVEKLGRGEFIHSPHELVRLLGAARGRRVARGQVQRLFDELTPRECEVLAALAKGLSDREIAERLVVGIETVHSHVTGIIGKLGVHSRLQAVLLALRHGAVELP